MYSYNINGILSRFSLKLLLASHTTNKNHHSNTYTKIQFSFCHHSADCHSHFIILNGMNFPHFLIPWLKLKYRPEIEANGRNQRKHHKLTNQPSTTTTVSMTKNIILPFVYPSQCYSFTTTNKPFPPHPKGHHPPIHKQQNPKKKVFKKQFLFSSIFFHFHFNIISILFSSVFPDGHRRLVLIVLDGLNTNKWL